MKQKDRVNILFFIGYVLIIFSEMFINIPIIERYSNVITLIGIIFVSIYNAVKLSHSTYKLVVAFILMAVLGIISYAIIKDFTILKLTLLLFAVRNFELDEYIKFDFVTRIVFVLGVFLCSQLGLCNTTEFTRNSTIRYTLGFIHPNTAGFYLMLIGMEYLYIGKKYRLIIPALLSIAILKITDSRTAFIILIFAIIATILVKKFNKIMETKAFQFIAKNLLLIIMILLVVLTKLYIMGNPLANMINPILSNRLYYYSIFMNMYNISISGQNITAYYILDSSYFQMLYHYGLIVSIMYYILYYKSINIFFKNKNYTLIVMLICMALYAIMENSGYKSTYNIFILSFSVLFMTNKINLVSKRSSNAIK